VCDAATGHVFGVLQGGVPDQREESLLTEDQRPNAAAAAKAGRPHRQIREYSNFVCAEPLDPILGTVNGC